MDTHHPRISQVASARKFLQTGAVLAVSGSLMLTGMASGATLLLDFGTSTAYTGTNDPAHVDGSVPLSNTTWNAVTAGTGAHTVYDGGTPYTLYLGRNPNSTVGDPYDKIDFDIAPGATATSTTGTGIFATDLTNDALASHITTAPRDPVAALMTNLPLGQYYVYVVGHYAGNVSDAFNVLAGATSVTGPDGVSFSTTGSEIQDLYTVAQSAPLGGGNSSAWVSGTNYGKFTVNLTSANPSLVIGVDAAQGSVATSRLTAVMITSVPEPTSLGLLGLGGLAMLRRRRRQ